MQPTITEPEPTRDLRRVINAVHDLSELEAQISACKTIDEVEDIRLRCQAIQSYARERDDLGSALVTWAKRCAVLCQLRITEIQDFARRKRNGEVPNARDFASKNQRNREAEARLVASLPPEELTKQLETSGSVQLIARKVRKARQKAPKSTPKQLEQSRTRYYRAKAKKLGRPVEIQPPPPKLSPSQKFERYWTQEKKLLGQFFGDSDLSVIEAYWVREFQVYRKDVEDGKRERDNALAKLKTHHHAENGHSAS